MLSLAGDADLLFAAINVLATGNNDARADVNTKFEQQFNEYMRRSNLDGAMCEILLAAKAGEYSCIVDVASSQVGEIVEYFKQHRYQVKIVESDDDPVKIEISWN